MAARKSSKNPGSKPPEINPKYCFFQVEARPSKIHRWGLYALEDIPVRKKVMEYTGERISRAETKRRADEQHRLIYLFTLNSYWTLDGAVGGSGAEFVNHCCDPNLVADIHTDKIFYVSRRAISKGDELTIDYHFAKNVQRVICKCGSPICRGTINLR